MHRRSWFPALLMVMVFAFVILPGASQVRAEDAPAFSLTVSNASPVAGTEVTVEANVRNVTDLYGYEVNVTYDAAVLQFLKEEPAANKFMIAPIVRSNTVQLARTSIGKTEGLSGNVSLTRLTFKVLKPGSTELKLTTVKLVDSNQNASELTSGATVRLQAVDGATNPGHGHGGGSRGGNSGQASPITEGNGQNGIEAGGRYDDASRTAHMAIDGETWAKAIQQAQSVPGSKGILKVIVKEMADAELYALEVPAEVLSGQKSSLHIEIATPYGTLLLQGDMLKQNSSMLKDKVELYIGRADVSKLDANVKKLIGDRPAITLQLRSGDQVIAWNQPDTPVTVGIPYVPTAEELQAPEHIAIRYIDGLGTVHAVPNGKYDPLKGQVVFTTTHFSMYAVTFAEGGSYRDLAGYPWAQKPIEVLTAKGIISGVSDSEYNPGAKVTRADFLVLLTRTLELKGELGERFSDVREEDYFDEALRIARGLGIAQGEGGNRFQPNAPITREEMMVLTERALKTVKKQLVEGNRSELASFQDGAQVADYAVTSVAALLKAGLVQGDDHGIHPKETTTRAEAAVLMYNVYNFLSL
ncbi:S-layer homology domain-containing protein [Paenibacillus rigui]|uniref:SLH domain-containing protein n=1 Tax=Paenibacillus rigui TaxID=554312 RepID=A0A229UUD9_9BACL|nr:S-layer homology domain-containing protein [Paenibacillus rigui]OXM87217.1 hypothetical protein CF651_06110 [Paenibacillus rigui]